MRVTSDIQLSKRVCNGVSSFEGGHACHGTRDFTAYTDELTNLK